jgi:ankyrin repeat protein
MEELLSRNANPNISDTEGQSPLHRVVYTRDCLMASSLIKHAAHTSMVGTEGHSAIYYAARSGSDGIVKAILQSGRCSEQLTQFEGEFQAYNTERKSRTTSEGTTLNPRPKTTATTDQEPALDRI